MNRLSYRSFHPPDYLTAVEQVRYCISVIDRYQAELPQIRAATTILKRQKKEAEDEVAYWRQKYQEEKREKESLEKENTQLKDKIEKLTKTTNRYRASLFDHGNFQSPSQTNTKKKGGQPGHANTNREQADNTAEYDKQRVFATACSTCGTQLPRVTATEQKLLLDIVLNPQVVRLLITAERQWCGQCKKEVRALADRSLPFTEYGLNTLMMILLLRFRCLLPFSKIALVLEIGYGLIISQSGISSLLRQAKKYLNEKYEELKRAVRDGEIMYADETGWQVRGKNAWLWIMASAVATVYVAAESRGKGIFADMYGTSQADCMHDGYGAYANTIPSDKQLYCWAHILRFAFEETVDRPPDSPSVQIRDDLVLLYHLSKDPRYQGNSTKLEQELTTRMDIILNQPITDTATKNILHRVQTQRDGLIRALLVSPNGTNNFAEQELRPMALMRKISCGSDTYTGMETTAVLASVIQTITRTQPASFFSNLATAIRGGFGKS